MRIEGQALLVAGLVLGALLPAYAQQMYKCTGGYQDRPCSDLDEQKRYSHGTGSFTITQVNPDTDKECARVVSDVLPFWQRMKNGETIETLKAEIDARPISRFEKSRARDGLIMLAQYRGTQQRVRSELESQCMAGKTRGGNDPASRDRPEKRRR